jgi:hypothetical protein
MGYTDYRPNSYEVHDRNIDEVIGMMESHPDYRYKPGWFLYFSGLLEAPRRGIAGAMPQVP